MNDCSTLNKKRLVLGILVSFVFLYLWGWLFHGHCMSEMYMQTAQMWRPMEEMMANMKWVILGHATLAIFLGKLFAKGYEGKGIKEGLRFGVCIGLLLAVPHNIMWYAVAPVTAMFAVYQGIGCLVATLGVGIIMSLIYKKA